MGGEEKEQGLHAYDAPLINDDVRRFTQCLDAPVLEAQIIESALIWNTLHPYASDQARLRLVMEFADAVGVVVDM